MKKNSLFWMIVVVIGLALIGVAFAYVFSTKIGYTGDNYVIKTHADSVYARARVSELEKSEPWRTLVVFKNGYSYIVSDTASGRIELRNRMGSVAKINITLRNAFKVDKVVHIFYHQSDEEYFDASKRFFCPEFFGVGKKSKAVGGTTIE